MEENNRPHFVRVTDFRIDHDYIEWFKEIKRRYQSAQLKAAIKINSEKLSFNWSLGKDLVTRKAEEKWGAGVVEQLSSDLQQAFPNDKGFSKVNLWRMKRWYQIFSTKEANEKLSQLGTELQSQHPQLNTKLPQVGEVMCTNDSLPLVLGLVPWRHQDEIISKCKDLDEALFYIKMCILEGWSRATLVNSIKGNLYQNYGKALSNYDQFLSEAQSRLAQEITKENYDFGFVTVPANYTEEQLETELEKNITRFLLELGTGFAFMGRQKQLVVGGKTRRIDMLFYHVKLKAYCVVELKTVPFDPAFTGKLNFYVNAVDELLKGSDDNPTIGLLICSDKNETDVRWAFKGIETPLGVASYDNVNVTPTNLLPSAEELQARVRLLEEEMNKKKE